MFPSVPPRPARDVLAGARALVLAAAVTISSLLAASTAEAQIPANALRAGCQINVTWVVGTEDAPEIVDLLFVALDGDTLAILATGTANDGFELVSVPCLETGLYEGRLTATSAGEVVFSGDPRILAAVAPRVDLALVAGAAGDTCERLVTFRGFALDDCGIAAEGVTVTVAQVGGSGALGAPTVTVAASGDTVHVVGSVLVTVADSAVTVRVTVTAADGCELVTTLAREITVSDDTAPVVTCPEDITLACDGPGGKPADDPALAAFLDGFTAVDACDAGLTLANDAPDFFPLGATTVTFTATDGSGNSASCTATVTVIDTIPPAIDVTLNRTVLWPPNHKFHEILASVTVTDACDPEPLFTLLSIESDESPNGNGDGNTQPDVRGERAGTADLAFDLRAERSGRGDGRIYTITYVATDAAGNEALGVATVRVPHDRRGRAKPSNGYAVTGQAFSGDDRFAILVPGWIDAEDGAVVDASTIRLAETQIGNMKGVVAPDEIYVGDVDGDTRRDAVFVFGRAAAEALHLKARGLEEKTSLHFADRNGNDWVVYDIFDLGTPVAVDLSTLERFEDAGDAEDEGDDTGGDTGEDAGTLTPLGSLLMAQPNPFKPSTSVRFRVPAAGEVSLRIYDIAGRPVRVLAEGYRAAGEYSVPWDGTRERGGRLSPGVYLIRLTVPGASATEKAVLLE
jgi:hypothetical protein